MVRREGRPTAEDCPEMFVSVVRAHFLCASVCATPACALRIACFGRFNSPGST